MADMHLTSRVCVMLLLMCFTEHQCQTPEDDKVRQYLEGENGYNKRVAKVNNELYVAEWNYFTNLTDYNAERMEELSLKNAELEKNESVAASKFNISAMTNASLIRQLNKILDVGISGYNDTEVLKKITSLEADMTDIYSSAKWCKTPNDCKYLEPDLVDLMALNRSYDELKSAWKGWRDVSGANMKQMYVEFVELQNKAIKAGGKYEDTGAYYRSKYEQATFEDDVRRLFVELRPLYDQLHAYVRRILRVYYGRDKFPASGHIPAHLFGNMWAQSWNSIYDLLEPFPGQGRKSLTTEMKNQNYNITRMYRLAEEFFTSIGMKPMPDSFWTLSMLEKPTDGRDVVCHASAWDMANGTDFRIKQCTVVTEENLITVHHEMGHIEYYLEYLNQPYLFQDGANPGFHEGVADIVSLSFQTPEHLKKIGLIQNLPNGTEGDINFLLQMALDKIAFLPFGYLVDQWRWSVYRGETKPENYNRDWWKLRCHYQGISPPVPRSENDFDPGAKFHIPGNTPYIRYFVSYVLQFQWHQALCRLINNTGPLHRCDIYQNKMAGARLQEMLRMGSSRPWGEALRTLTRGTVGETDRLSAQALLDYFKPLQVWLEAENQQSGEMIGWDRENCPTGSFTTSGCTKLASLTALLMILVWLCEFLLND